MAAKFGQGPLARNVYLSPPAFGGANSFITRFLPESGTAYHSGSRHALTASHSSTPIQLGRYQNTRGGIHGKSKRAGVFCIGVEGSENESGGCA